MDPAKNDEARRKLTDKGASLVSSLKLRVSRLEATLKDKEAELAKLQASAKATALNEMKIEAETYYQEVVRLRNQLNIAQHQQQQQQQYHSQKSPQEYSPHHSQQFNLPIQQPPPPPLPPPHHRSPQMQDPKGANINHWSNMRNGRDSRNEVRSRRDGDGQESPTANLRHALVQLEEENVRLGNQVSTLTDENVKLTSDMERVLGLSEDVKSTYDEMSRAELIREMERRQEELNRLTTQQSQLSEALTRRNDMVGEGSAILQARVSELQAREVEWERERSSLRELISTLKEDRMFYKETAQKKDSELDGLRSEVQTLQQEVIGLHESQQRRRNERQTPSMSHRSLRGSTRVSQSASRSGSSSDTSVLTRRPRPSSARPPSVSSRTHRSDKASSEPREVPPRVPRVNNVQRASSTRSSQKPSGTSRSKSSSSSSPSKTPASSIVPSGSRSGGVGSRQRSSTTPPKASPYGSPKHSSYGRGTSLSSPSKTSTPTSSPRKTAGSVSPQHKGTGSVSPQRKPPTPSSSGGRIPVSHSASKTNTPSSSVKSSPVKTSASTPNRSPSKVPLARSSASPVGSSRSVGSPVGSSRSVGSPVASSRSGTSPVGSHRSVASPVGSSRASASPVGSSRASPAGSPSKKGSKQEERASPARSSRTSSKQDTLKGSSTSSTKVLRHHNTTTTVAKTSYTHMSEDVNLLQPEFKQDYCFSQQLSPHTVRSPHSPAHMYNYQAGMNKEEDERVLAEIIFHRETDSSGEASDHLPLARQRTITLSTQDEECDIDQSENVQEQPGGTLQRQNTVTLSKTEDEEEEGMLASREGSQETIVGEDEREEDFQKESDYGSERLQTSCEEAASLDRDEEIAENIEVLQSLLLSHLSRYKEVNELLSREPLLVGEGQVTNASPQRQNEVSVRHGREAPDGEETFAHTSSSPPRSSQNLVRQGTFNVNEEEEEIAATTIHSTLDAHLTRVNKVHHYTMN